MQQIRGEFPRWDDWWHDLERVGHSEVRAAVDVMVTACREGLLRLLCDPIHVDAAMLELRLLGRPACGLIGFFEGTDSGDFVAVDAYVGASQRRIALAAVLAELD